MKLHRFASLFVWFCVLLFTAIAQTKPAPATAPTLTFPEKLPTTEFARIVREFSEPSGEFHSDNLLSNEMSYLTVVDKLKELNAANGVYIGVGPEQNFTYIAKTRPRVAFIIDLRGLAQVQHLTYKALFQLAPTRAEYLSRWLSIPLGKGKAPASNAPLSDLLQYFSTTPLDEKYYAANLTEIRKVIQKDYLITLTTEENQALETIMSNFKENGLRISYQLKNGYRSMYFPTLNEILGQTDSHGQQGNFLGSDDDYNFVRGLQAKNLLIPVTGNFAGTKAFAAVGDYLRKYNLKVTTIYTSNVEQYLFQYRVFDAFAENVKKLPIHEQSVFIRSVTSRVRHPARGSGQMFISLLQRVPLFLTDFTAGKYQDYESLVTTNYIAPEEK